MTTELNVLCCSDRVIQRKRRDYLDPNSSNNMKKLNDDLQSIHSIMRKTIDDVLDRYSAVCMRARAVNSILV